MVEKIAKEGARTIPGREHGGNCDVRQLPCPMLHVDIDLLSSFSFPG